MSAIDPIFSEHDTALIEEKPHLERHCLRLVSGSAHEYERRRQVIEKDLAPMGTRVATVLGIVGFVLLAFGGFYGLYTLADVSLPRLTQVTLYAIYISLPLLAVAGILAILGARRGTLQERALDALDEEFGAEVIDFPNYYRVETYMSPSGWETTLTRVANQVTPDVRDRLLGLVAQGKKDAARTAASILLSEAGDDWRNQRDREAMEALESKELAARRALGRP